VIRFLSADGVPGAEINRRLSAQYMNSYDHYLVFSVLSCVSLIFAVNMEHSESLTQSRTVFLPRCLYMFQISTHTTFWV
jgi:hypothetical protein